MNTGTIFDSPWFKLEQPAFRKIAAESNQWLTIALILAAIVLVIIALYPNTPTIVKAVVLAYVILP